MAFAMLTIAEVMVARLRANVAAVDDASIRYSHRILVAHDDSPAIYVIPQKWSEGEGKNCQRRVATLVVAVLVRADDGLAVAGPIIEAVAAALDPSTSIPAAPYPNGVRVKLGPGWVNEAGADTDACRVDIDYEAAFDTNGEHSLAVA